MKILVVAPSWVGDMVMAQSLFIALKKQYPSAQIDVYAPSWCLALARVMPQVSATIENVIPHKVLGLKQRYQIGKALRKNQYDAAYVLPNSFKSALIPFFAQIPLRIGYIGEARYGLLTRWYSVDKKKHPRMVERFFALAYKPKEVLPQTELPKLVVSESAVSQILKKYQVHTPYIVLCPGAEYGPSKQWPLSYFKQIYAHFSQKMRVVVLGSHKEHALGQDIAGAEDNLCGKTTLDEAITIIAGAQKVLTHDSGLMHIASALGIPLVALYGSSSPIFTPPLSARVRVVQHKLSCQPCFKRTCPLGHHACMQKIEPQQIIPLLEETF